MTGKKHPHVSEADEGSPTFEWAVAVMVVLSAVVAFIGHIGVATAILAATAFGTGLTRLMLRARSPWKVRSVAFDVFISVGLGIGLIAVYISIRLMT